MSVRDWSGVPILKRWQAPDPDPETQHRHSSNSSLASPDEVVFAEIYLFPDGEDKRGIQRQVSRVYQSDRGLIRHPTDVRRHRQPASNLWGVSILLTKYLTAVLYIT